MDAHELANKLRNSPNNESLYIEDVIKWCDENAGSLNLSDPDEMFLCEKATKYLMENKGKRTWSKDDAKYITIFLAKKTLKELNLDQITDIQILTEDEYTEMYGDREGIVRGVCIPQQDNFFHLVYSPEVIYDLISDNKERFLHGLQTIYHEIRHAQQNKSIRREIREDGTEIQKNKERYLSALETVARKLDEPFYKKNYSHLLKENDADKYGLIKAFTTIKVYSTELCKKYSSKQIQEKLQEYDKNYYDALSSKGTLYLKQEIETRAAIYIMNHPEILNDFPILNVAFNKDGTKRDVRELLEERDQLLEDNQNTEVVNELYQMIINFRNPSHGGLNGTKDELFKINKYIQKTGTEDEFVYNLIRYKLEHKTNMTEEQIDAMMETIHSEALKIRQKRNKQGIAPQEQESIIDQEEQQI